MQKELRSQVASMKEYFDRSTRVLSEEDSGFAPAPGMFTVVQQVAHVAQTVEWFINGAFAESGFDLNFEELDRRMRAVSSLAAAREWMDRACAAAGACVDAHSDAEWSAPLPPGLVMGGEPRHAVFGAMADHTAHHRGALTVYSRLLGKVPAMPYADM